MEQHLFPHMSYIDLTAFANSKYFLQQEALVQELLSQLRVERFGLTSISNLLSNTLQKGGILKMLSKDYQACSLSKYGYHLNLDEIHKMTNEFPHLKEVIQNMVYDALRHEQDIIWNTLNYYKFIQPIAKSNKEEDTTAKANKNDE